jgi:hypothetical protein
MSIRNRSSCLCLLRAEIISSFLTNSIERIAGGLPADRNGRHRCQLTRMPTVPIKTLGFCPIIQSIIQTHSAEPVGIDCDSYLRNILPKWSTELKIGLISLSL